MSSAQPNDNITAVEGPSVRADAGRSFPLNDYALERIIYRAPHQALAPIQWPDGLAPRGAPYNLAADQPLPRADVVVVTWTVAEGQALADVLTPGLPSVSWKPYAHQWSSYEPQLTSRSPARQAGCLAYVANVKIGNVNVLLLKSELHLATDAISAPIVALWQQIVDEARPNLVITTGTAGGIGAATQLGDVFVVTNAKFNCTRDFRTKPWAQQLFTGPAIHAESHAGSFGALTAPNAGHLFPVATRPPVLTFGAAAGGVETVDYFGFANTTDSFGIVRNYPDARTEEMDDATLPLALAQLPSPPLWCSIRNASDPQVSSDIGDLDAQQRWANQIYKRYGYWTTVGSAIATWTVIANHS
jgi:nucleoside phosphorylase